MFYTVERTMNPDLASMYETLGVSPAVYRYGEAAVSKLRTRFDEMDRMFGMERTTGKE